MKFVELTKQRFESNLSQLAIVIRGNKFTYGDILTAWNGWNKKLTELNVTHQSVVMVRGEFDSNSIGLMLAIIQKSATYVPISKVVKSIERFQDIAEVTHYFDLEQDTFRSLEKEPENPLYKRLHSTEKPGLILFSSGTTGEPKASLHNVSYMLEKYEAKGKRFRSIAFLLFDHIGGFNTVLYCISNMGTIVVPQNRSPNEVLELIQEYKVEVLPTSPSFINMLLVSGQANEYDISSLKVVTYGTEPMPEATLKSFNKKFPQIRMKQTYGLSEVGILKTKSKDSSSLWMKVGDGKDHKIEVRDGILWIKSKMSMLGYLNADSPFDENGWFNTQDQVEVEGEYMKILGRTTDLINVGGEKVYPSEVESVILEVDGVKEAVVRGEKNHLMGSVVVCYVDSDNRYEKSELKKMIKMACKERLEKFKRPVKINVTNSSFYSDRFKKITSDLDTDSKTTGTS